MIERGKNTPRDIADVNVIPDGTGRAEDLDLLSLENRMHCRSHKPLLCEGALTLAIGISRARYDDGQAADGSKHACVFFDREFRNAIRGDGVRSMICINRQRLRNSIYSS